MYIDIIRSHLLDVFLLLSDERAALRSRGTGEGRATAPIRDDGLSLMLDEVEFCRLRGGAFAC